MSCLKVISRIRLKELKKAIKSSVRIISIPTEIQTGFFPNTNQKRFRMGKFVGRMQQATTIRGRKFAARGCEKPVKFSERT
jgi:hypothetical protein